MYLTTADRWGNMASFIYSVYDYFGSSVSIPGYGFPMNDRGSFFNLDPSSPDVIAPHKRPFLTIIPAFVMKDGQPLLSFGNMGGDEQAQAQATEIVNMIDLGMNVQAAGDAARFHQSQSSRPGRPRVGALRARRGEAEGDGLQRAKRRTAPTTCSAATRRSSSSAQPGLKPPPEWTTAGDPPVNGVYRAGSDFRKDGEAVGW